MIKVNLAHRKQAAGVADFKEKPASAGFSFKGVDLEILKAPEIRKFALAIVVAIMASYVLDGVKQDQIDKVSQRMEKANADNAKAKADLAKTTGFEGLKKQIDADEDLIRTKLSTIQKLVADRQMPPKMLMSFSGSIPKDVWITEFEVVQGIIKIRGAALSYESISDFLKALTENDLLTDVKLGNSEKAKDPIAGEVDTFEMEAKRK